MLFDRGYDLRIQPVAVPRHGGVFGLDAGAEFLAEVADQDLDAGAIDVRPVAERIIDAQHRLQVAEQLRLRHELPQHGAEEGRAAKPAANHHPKAHLPFRVAERLEADVVQLGRHPVMRTAGDGDLELARQPGELRVQRGPLPEDFGIDPRIDHLIPRGAGVFIGGDVADAIAAGLDGMHVHIRQRLENGRHILELGPIELDVLPRREMPETTIPTAGDDRQLAQLRRRQHAIGDRHAEHIGVQLEIEAVHQPERLELLLGQRAGEAALHLVGELGDPLPQEGAVDLVVAVGPGFRRGQGVHLRRPASSLRARPRPRGPRHAESPGSAAGAAPRA